MRMNSASKYMGLPFDLQALRNWRYKRFVLPHGLPRIPPHVGPPHPRMTPDYAHCYAVLGVDPHCDWPRLREHYRLLAKQWHPDHFRADASGVQQAEEKIKEINQAFYTLSQYYRRHGELPAATAHQWFEHTADSTPNTSSTPDTVLPQRHRSADASGTQQEIRARKWRYAAVGVAALVISGLAMIFKPTPPAQALIASSPMRTPSPAVAIAVLPDAVLGDGYFTVGSTLGEVHAIQGTPTRVERDTWYYGNAKVWFRQGVVHRWEDDPLAPLKARTDAGPLVRATRFRVGSTMHEVRSIQGKPTHEGENVWDYGVSRVYFKGDRVAGWDNSPLNPLKVR